MFDRLKALFQHSKTILIARLVSGAGLIVSVHDWVAPIVMSSGVDLTPLIPAQYYSLLVLGLGLLFEGLRWFTTQSLAEKKVDAAVAEVVKAQDAVVAAVAKADEAEASKP